MQAIMPRAVFINLAAKESVVEEYNLACNIVEASEERGARDKGR